MLKALTPKHVRASKSQLAFAIAVGHYIVIGHYRQLNRGGDHRGDVRMERSGECGRTVTEKQRAGNKLWEHAYGGKHKPCV